jgi:hypothetical protein
MQFARPAASIGAVDVRPLSPEIQAPGHGMSGNDEWKRPGKHYNRADGSQVIRLSDGLPLPA